MRILILSWRDMSHPLAGGSEVYVTNLARRWAAAGHEVTMFASSFAGAPCDEVVDGYRMVRNGGRMTVYREARRWYEAQAAGSFDVVLDVINTRPFLAPRYVKDCPVVALIHQVAREVWRYEMPLPAAVVGRYLLEPRWLRCYQGETVLTVSESSRASLRPYGLSHAAVVGEGSDPPPAGAFRPPRESGPTALFVGRLSANKRPDHAIEAFGRYARSHPDASLWVVGDGPMIDRLRRAAPPGTTFFGRLPEPEKLDLMSRAHALLVTSVREGWGLVVSEAAQVGLRTIAYDVDGLRDSVPKASGVLTHPSPGALADAMEAHLLEWSERDWTAPDNLGTRSWDDIAADVLAAVDGAAATR